MLVEVKKEIKFLFLKTFFSFISKTIRATTIFVIKEKMWNQILDLNLCFKNPNWEHFNF